MEKSANYSDPFLKKLTEVVEAHYTQENFGVSELAGELGMSRSNLHRKVKTLTNKSVSRFISEVRLKKALELLQEKAGNVSEVAYKVGFGSVTYFSKCFHDQYGFAPGEVLNGTVLIPEDTPEETEETEKETPKKSLQKATLYLVGSLSAVAILVVVLLLWSGNKPLPYNVMVLLDEPNAENIRLMSTLAGLQESFFNDLDKLEKIDPVSIFTSEKYARDSVLDISAISKKGIQYIIGIRLVTTDRDTNVVVHVTQTSNDKHLGSIPVPFDSLYNYPVFARKKLVHAAVEEILGKVDEEIQKDFASATSKNKEAQKEYDLALYYLQKSPYPENQRWHLAKKHFIKAIQLDSTFSSAYTQLAHINLNNLLQWTPPDKKQEFMDSSLLLIEKALRFDENNGWAWGLKGDYFINTKNYEEAEKCYFVADGIEGDEYGKCIGLLGRSVKKCDYPGYVENFCMYLAHIQKEEEPQAWTSYAATWNLFYMGFPELAKVEAKKYSDWRNNPFLYDDYLYQIELKTGNFEKAKEVIHENFKNYKLDWQQYRIYFQMMYADLILGNETEAYNYLQELEKFTQTHTDFKIDNEIPIAWLYLQNGRKAEADSMLQTLEKNALEWNKNSNIHYTHGIAEHTLASVYAIKGENEKAISYIEKLAEKKVISQWMLLMFKTYPWFADLREEPEFNQLMSTLESKWNNEHKRLKKLFEKEGILKS